MNISDSKSLLTSAQVSLLQSCAVKRFFLGGFSSLDDIVTKLKVDVLIEPGIPKRMVEEYYDKAIMYWRKEYKQLFERSQRDGALMNECQKAEEKLWMLSNERKAHSSTKLLGLYDDENNVIKLFPEAMTAADASKMDEYLVSTFAHEVMHAYFNRPGHEKYPYAMFVEEPLAEFGMLLYLHETDSKYYDWAHNNVSSKKCCYRYGADILDQYLGGDVTLKTYLEEYKIPIGEYEMLDISNGHVYMPKEGDFVDVADQPFVAEWSPVYDILPTYFWDDATKTLGLDGDWRGRRDLSNRIRILLHYHLIGDIEHLYIGKDYICDRSCRDFDIPTMVSPKHKELTSINGILVRKEDYKDIENIGEGYFKLKRDGKWGILDSKLKPITPFQYDIIEDFDKNDLCKVMIDNSWGLVNKQGEEHVPVKYEDIEMCNEFYVAELNDKYAIIDLNNNTIPQFKYDYISKKFDSNDLCKVMIDNSWGLVNKQGVEQVPTEYEDIRELKDYDNFKNDTRYYKVFLNKKWGIIDSYNNKITQIIYDKSIFCRPCFDENGLCEVMRGKRYGLVNKQGVEQVPVVYEEEIIRFDVKYMSGEIVTRVENEYGVKLNGEKFRIDKFGNKIDKSGKKLV